MDGQNPPQDPRGEPGRDPQDLAPEGKDELVRDGSEGGTLFSLPASDADATPTVATRTPPTSPGAPPAGGARPGDPSEASPARTYRILGEIGRGGMASILLAEDPAFGREVAMKVAHPRIQEDRLLLQRFLNEARITGQLDHPSIPPAHDAGVGPGGERFFTMKRVRGRSLAAVIQKLHDRDPATVAEYPLSTLLEVFLKVCEAVAFAHDRGVIHRDIKPENVMVGRFGEVFVMDWGLAKVLGREGPLASAVRAGPGPSGDPLLSQDGTVLGTPAYMAPEQADGKLEAVDRLSDVYSLGALLYEILTLERPVEGQTSAEVLYRVIEGKIRRPRATAPGRRIPPPLESVCLKAMAKEKGDRYTRVADLAADVRAFLEHRPVLAHRYSVSERLLRTVQRHPAGSLAGAATLLLAAVAAGVSFFGISAQRNEAVRARGEAEEKRREAVAAGENAERQRGLAERSLADAMLARAEAIGNLRRAEAELYANGILQAQAALDRGEVPAAQRALAGCPSRLRGWEWGYLSDLADASVLALTGHEDWVFALAFHPDGRTLASGGGDGLVKVWDLAAGRDRTSWMAHREKGAVQGGVFALSWDAEGRRLVTGGGDGRVRVWDAPAGRLLAEPQAHAGAVSFAAFSPCGRRILTADLGWGVHKSSVRVCDAGTGAPLWEHPLGREFRIAHAPDGSRVLAFSRARKLVWDAETGEVLESTPMAFGEEVAALSPDFSAVLCRRSAFDMGLFRPGEAKAFASWSTRLQIMGASAFRPDGGAFATAEENRVTLRDAATGAPRAEFPGHGGRVFSFAFSRDGLRLASGDAEGAIRVWDASGARGTREVAIPAFLEIARGAAYCREAGLLAALHHDSGDEGGGEGRIEEVETSRRLPVLSGHALRMTCL
ncbi:MAG: serine/threonine protein kinase, partial [Planctomycetes bacterium]|nr:serine/threonine protein kinase [Planctomycetota bacterium]